MASLDTRPSRPSQHSHQHVANANPRGSSWVPAVDTVLEDGELVVRAALPGVDADRLTVEVTDDSIQISGDRRTVFELDAAAALLGRRAGHFFREVLLPRGADTELARATYRAGVLEVRMPAPARAPGLARPLAVASERSHAAPRRETRHTVYASSGSMFVMDRPSVAHDRTTEE